MAVQLANEGNGGTIKDLGQQCKRYKSQHALIPDLVKKLSLVYRRKASRLDAATWRIREKEV